MTLLTGNVQGCGTTDTLVVNLRPALVHQHADDGRVPTTSRSVEGGVLVLVARVDVGARGQQDAHHVDVA